MAIRSKYYIVLILALLALPRQAQAQQSNTTTMTRAEYIERYAPLAVEQQTLYGIPASITLAQGLLESGNGNSRLARQANNHFGIKCGSSWDGESIRHDDDALQECFRAYNSPEESYIDHSLILLERKWYRPLFDLDPKDYKAWAHGLKKAGYATNPRYADLLIKIIEDYELYRFDNALVADWQSGGEVASAEPAEEPQEVAAAESAEQVAKEEPRKVNVDTYTVALHKVGGYGIYLDEGRRYVVATAGDNLSRVAKSLGISRRQLRRINGFDASHTVIAGERIYLE